MALALGERPILKGLQIDSITLTPAATQGTGNSIPAHVRAVQLTANTTDVNDFTVLPSIAHVPVGHSITICAGAANSELRTPSGSGETINNVDSDGTAEALLTAGNTYTVTKKTNASASNWILVGYTNLGAVQTAIIPDA